MLDINSAKKEGYTDKEIAEYLSSKRKFDINGAREEGYSDADIVSHLTEKKNPFPTDRKQMEQQFEGGGLEQPWFDPIMAASGGFGAGAMGAKGAGLLAKVGRGLLGAGGAAVADLPSGMAGEIVGEKYPNLALPAAIATGIATGRFMQKPVDKLLNKLMPSTVRQAPQATRMGVDVLNQGEDVAMQSLRQPKAGSLAYGQELPKYTMGGAGNVNLNRMDAPYSVKKTINDLADQYSITKTKRTWVEIQDEADSIGMDTVKALKDRPANISPEAWIQAKRDVHVDSVTKLRALREQYANKALNDQEVASIRLAMEEAAGIQAQVSSNAADAGRSLNIHRKMAKAQASVDGYKTILEGLGGRELNKEMVEKFLSIDPNDPMAAAKFVRDATKARTKDKLYEAWINGLLTSPQSHIANITGNTLTFLFKPIMETPMTALLERVKGTITKQKPNVYFGESGAFLKGAKEVFKHSWSDGQKAGTFGKWQGIKDGVRASVKAFSNQLPDEIALAGKIEQTKRQAIKGKLGEIIRSPGSALQLADDMFKAISYRGELNAQAYRIATRQGLKGSERVQRISELLANPNREMLGKASHEALYRTFNNPNPVASFIMRGKNVPVIGTPMKYILPFVRTPANIATFALQRTPLALPYAKNSEDVGRILSGTLLGIGTMQLVSEGYVTGGGPKDKEQKEALYDTGWQPYSFKIGDKYYSYNRLEPIGSIIGMTADMYEIIDGKYFKKERSPKDYAAQIALSFSKNITSKTFMVGLSNAMDALSEPDRYGERFLNQYAGSLIPSVVGTVARATDPTIRATETPLDVMKSRLPIASKTLPPRRNKYGEEVKRGAGAGNFWTRMFSPMYISQDTKDPVAKEILRLGLEVAAPSRTVSGVKLTPEQYDKYSEYAGKKAWNKIYKRINSRAYGTMKDEKKRIMIKSIFEGLREGEVPRSQIKGDVSTNKKKQYGIQ